MHELHINKQSFRGANPADHDLRILYVVTRTNIDVLTMPESVF